MHTQVLLLLLLACTHRFNILKNLLLLFLLLLLHADLGPTGRLLGGLRGGVGEIQLFTGGESFIQNVVIAQKLKRGGCITKNNKNNYIC